MYWYGIRWLKSCFNYRKLNPAFPHESRRNVFFISRKDVRELYCLLSSQFDKLAKPSNGEPLAYYRQKKATNLLVCSEDTLDLIECPRITFQAG